MSRIRPRRPRCPTCGGPAVPDLRPFCSSRCRDVDLGRWLTGGYRNPTEETPDAEEVDQALRDGEGTPD